jgi:hypothetical protein
MKRSIEFGRTAFRIGIGAAVATGVLIVAVCGFTYALGKGLKTLGTYAIAVLKGESVDTCL